jgi:hypothetical protein
MDLAKTSLVPAASNLRRPHGCAGGAQAGGDGAPQSTARARVEGCLAGEIKSWLRHFHPVPFPPRWRGTMPGRRAIVANVQIV